jgi:radical SAM-linked protein
VGLSGAEAQVSGGELLQRLRLTYMKGEQLKYISHLDLARAWERIFRRAGLPLAHSQGYNPRPRFQMASGLPVGVTGRAELLDVWLAEPLAPADALARLRATLPPGIEMIDAIEVDLHAPALQALLRAADYQVRVRTTESLEALRARVSALLAAGTLPRRRQHKGDWQVYDLRPLIQSIGVECGEEGETVFLMRLQASPQGAGRPDEVLDALGLKGQPHRMERTGLHFEEPAHAMARV